MRNIKKLLFVLLALIMIFSLIACDSSNPGDETPHMNKFNVATSYKGNKDGNFFTFKFNWKVDETYSATYTQEYDLYWSMDEFGPYELIEPNVAGYVPNTEVFTLVPGEKSEFTINVDDKYDGLTAGYYRFVFSFDVSENGGEAVKHIAEIDFNMGV